MEQIEKDLISVIIPVYNAEKELGRCIESILKQSYINLQILIIDDGSEDSSLSIARSYEKEDNRIFVFHQMNQGVSSARNLGIEKAEGKYLVFVDGDDFISDDMIERLFLNMAREEQIDVSICNYKRNGLQENEIEGECEVLNKEEAICRLFYRDSYQGFLCNKMFRTEVIKGERLLLNPEISICEDLLFCSLYFSHIRKAVYDSRVCYFYEETGFGATRSDQYNPRRYTMLKSFDEIEKAWDTFASERIKKAAYNYLATVCMLLFKMTVKYHKEADKNAMNQIISHLKKTGWYYLNSEWQTKFKIAYVPLKLVSYFRK